MILVYGSMQVVCVCLWKKMMTTKSSDDVVASFVVIEFGGFCRRRVRGDTRHQVLECILSPGRKV